LALPAVAADDIQQVTLEDGKRTIRQAEKFIRRGEFVEAEKLLRRATELNPADSAVKLKLAFVRMKRRDLGEAYDLSLTVAKNEPKNAYAYAVLGTTLLAVGRFNDADAILKNAIHLDKKEALAWAGYGLLDFYMNRINDSVENLRNSVFLEPSEPDYLFALAQVCARAEKYREAAENYRKFLLVARNTDDERKERIRGLVRFLDYLGGKESLYVQAGAEKTTVKFALKGNRPIIELRVNDRPQPLRFVLDTGSGISVISDDTAKRMKISSITKGGFAKGIGGDGRFEIVYGFLRQVAIGDIKVRNVPIYIRKFHNNSNDVDGYIGLSLISKFLTTIDYGAQTFSLTKRDEEEVRADGDMKGVSVPLRLTSSGFLSGEVQLEGLESPLNFIVDTGASVSVISDDVASVEPVLSFAQSEKMRVVGAAGITDGVQSFKIPRISFGSHSRTDVTAIALDLDTINETSGFEQAGILGGNFLKNYRMTFDFRNSRVTFVPINLEP
jgi:tetratricopeptide (TPR) repeat protein